MSTVLFKRGLGHDTNTFPIIDGQILFDEENYKIYVDNGTSRLQYGGDTDIIQDLNTASPTNVLSALSSSNLFLQKTTVVDDKDNALAVTSAHIPLGCLAFKDALGTDDYSHVGNGTISNGLVMLRGESLMGTLNVNETELTLTSTIMNSNSLVDIYTVPNDITPKSVVTNDNTKTITLTFKAQSVPVNVKAVVRNL